MRATSVEELRKRLTQAEPGDAVLRRASVAVILRDPDSPSLLLIKRADSPGDPWSGQIAFPGGKAQGGDRTVRETAIRETLEETGIDLGEAAEFLGYHSGFRTHTGAIDVIPSVFLLGREADLHPNDEVSSYRWVSLDELFDGRSAGSHVLEDGGLKREVPAVRVSGYVVWGLTYRIMTSLFG